MKKLRKILRQNVATLPKQSLTAMKVAFGVRAQYATIAALSLLMVTQVIGVIVFSGSAKAVGGVTHSMNITQGFSSPLSYSQATAVAPDGTMYIVSIGGDKIDKYNASGTAVAQIGGVHGSGNGQFNGPSAIAVDASSNLYVFDGYNKRVQKFDSSGAFVTKFGSPGSGDGQFQYSYDVSIAAAPNGTVFVSEMHTNRIHVFSSTGTFLYRWGTGGSAPGQIDKPAGLAVDPNGNIWLCDTNNNRIQKFTAAGGYMGTPVNNRCNNVAINRSGELYLTSNTTNNVKKFAADGTLIIQWGGAGSGNGQFDFDLNSPNLKGSGIAVDNQGQVYIADLGNGRVQVFADDSFDLRVTTRPATNINSSQAMLNLQTTDAAKSLAASYSFEYGPTIAYGSTANVISTGYGGYDTFGLPGEGSASGQLGSSPRGIAMDSQNNVYVPDTNNCRIEKFNSDGTHAGEWGTCGSDPGQFSFPWDIVVDQADNIFVADYFNNRIQKFDKDGVFILEWPSSYCADRLAIDSAENIYVTCSNMDKVQKFSPTGSLLLEFGSSGTSAGQFNSPTGVAIDPQGYIYVLESGSGVSHRVQKFDAQGNFVLQWGSSGSGDGQFEFPYNGMDIDGYGNIYINDASRVQVFAGDGTLISSDPLSAYGSGIAVGRNGNMTWLGSGLNGAPGVIGGRMGSVYANGLTCETEYHYRSVATVGAETVYGADQTFTTAACPEPYAFITDDLPNGTVAVAYDQYVEVNESSPFMYVLAGNLPPGLALGFDGHITGTPTTAGTYDFTVQSLDNSGNNLGSVDKDFQIIVNETPPPPFSITTTSLPDGTVASSYSQTIQTDAESPVVFSLQSGSLPAGLSLGSNGQITGTPTTAGISSFTVEADDGNMTDAQALSITIAAAPVVPPDPDPEPDPDVDPTPQPDVTPVDEAPVEEAPIGEEPTITDVTPLPAAPEPEVTTPIRAPQQVVVAQNNLFALAKRIPEPFAIGFPWLLLALALILVGIQYYQVHNEALSTKRVQQGVAHQKQLVEEQNNFVALSTHYLHTPLTVMEGEISLMIKAGTLSQEQANKLKATLASLSAEAEAVLAQEEQNE